MSWLTEWKAISAQIQGLLEASRFYVDSLQTLQTKFTDRVRDAYEVAAKEWTAPLQLESFHRDLREARPVGLDF